MRSYTPTRPVLPEEEDGTFDLLVKTYMPSDGGPFPPGGTISNYLDCMNEGRHRCRSMWHVVLTFLFRNDRRGD